jgi:branched-chain amino acid transport system permease protein
LGSSERFTLTAEAKRTEPIRLEEQMELSWSLLGQLAWTGLATSTFYYLFAIAFALVLKVNRVWNFAQAAIMVVAYFAMYVALQLWGASVALAIGVGILVTIAVSLALEWFGFRVLRNRGASVLTYFIFTIAISQFAVYLGELSFGADPKTLHASIMSPVVLVGSIAVSYWDLRAIGVAIALTLALAAFLRFTKDGQFLFAVADNPDLAQIYGIGLSRAYCISIAIAAVFVVAGMYLAGTRLPMYPATPLNQFLVLSVIATILAGIGNVFTAGAAAVVLGLIQTFSILVISSTWQILIVYVLIFVAILLFPSGITLGRPCQKISRARVVDDGITVPATLPEPENGVTSK